MASAPSGVSGGSMLARDYGTIRRYAITPCAFSCFQQKSRFDFSSMPQLCSGRTLPMKSEKGDGVLLLRNIG